MTDYTCAQCGGEFTSEWSDEEAEAEMRENFGELPDDDRAVVCDDCFKAMTSVIPLKTTMDDLIRRSREATEAWVKEPEDAVERTLRRIYLDALNAACDEFIFGTNPDHKMQGFSALTSTSAALSSPEREK